MVGDLVRRLDDVQAVVFDAYGTLFDIAAPVNKQAPILGDKAQALSALWRAKQLEYAWVRSLTGVHADFWHVTREALDFSLDSLGITETGLADELMSGLLVLDPFPEAGKALQVLRSKGRRLAILSNGSPSMLDAVVRHAGWEKIFEFVISVEDVGIYKPSRRVYRLATQKFGIHDAAGICFVSANGWDAHGAAQFGFRAVRVKRAPVPDERLPGTLTTVVTSLTDLEALL